MTFRPVRPVPPTKRAVRWFVMSLVCAQALTKASETSPGTAPASLRFGQLPARREESVPGDAVVALHR